MFYTDAVKIINYKIILRKKDSVLFLERQLFLNLSEFCGSFFLCDETQEHVLQCF